MIIEIEALDTLFFRNGKPFSMGDETWAEGIFPPSPSVIYGALRSAYFAEYPDELTKANTEMDPTSKLKINGIFIMIEDFICFPIPMDCVKNNNGNKYYLLSKEDSPISNAGTGEILVSKELSKSDSEGLLKMSIFKRYLNNEDLQFFFTRKSQYLYSEPKVGIGRNKETKTTDEGKLYRVGMIRPDRVKIVVDFSGIDLNSKGFMKLGGEGKMVNYKENMDSIVIEPPKIEKRFKLYFSTPSLFENGWLPKWINEQTLEGSYKNVKLKLISASIGKYISIGGFDMEKREPKIMRRAVPAGSVYYFNAPDGNAIELFDYFHCKSISEYQSSEGFGITFIGGIKQ